MSVIVEQNSNSQIRKYALSKAGRDRLQNEFIAYKQLADNPHIPALINHTFSNDQSELIIEYVDGESLQKWLTCDNDYRVSPKTWAQANVNLKRFVDAEMSLLNAGVLYRDLNLDHVIFRSSKAYFIDLEASVFKSDATNTYPFNDTRGTWETMAPEEFRGAGDLSERTATYRVAAISHMVLYGQLPFDHDATSRSTSNRLRHRPLRLNHRLSGRERKLFSAALSLEPARRHTNPNSFFNSLQEIMQQ